jgi:hypothetical protein
MLLSVDLFNYLPYKDRAKYDKDWRTGLYDSSSGLPRSNGINDASLVYSESPGYEVRWVRRKHQNLWYPLASDKVGGVVTSVAVATF